MGEQLRKLQWDLSSLQPFLKDFYIPHVAVLHRSADEVQAYRKLREVNVKVCNFCFCINKIYLLTQLFRVQTYRIQYNISWKEISLST